jgi:hypothetical protein
MEFGVPLFPPPGWSPYSRVAWTELRLQFRLPGDEPVISTRLCDYASREEIVTVITAVQQRRRELTAVEKQPAVKSASKAARDDAALAVLWAIADRQELNRLLTDLRRGEMPTNLDGRMRALPSGPARELLLQLHARFVAAREAAIEKLRQQWVPPPVDDAAWEERLRWMALSGVWLAREWLLPGERRLSALKRGQLIRERQDRYLAAHPERLEAVRRKAEEADGAKRGG